MKTRSMTKSTSTTRSQRPIQKKKKSSFFFAIVPDSSDDEDDSSSLSDGENSGIQTPEQEKEQDKYEPYEREFYEKLTTKRRNNIDSKELLIKEIKDKQNEVPLRFRLIESGMPVPVISATLDRINDIGDNEKIYKFVENLMRLPFGRFSTLPVGPKSSPTEIAAFLGKVQATLDEQVFGMDNVKKLFMVTTGIKLA